MAQRSPEAIARHLLADLSDDARRLLADAVAPARQTGSGIHDVLHAQLSAVTRSLRSRRPGIPLHAAACVLRDGRGLVIAGRTKAGKSTLVALLGAERGAAVVSDDTVWLADQQVTAIGAPLALRPGSPLWSRARGLWYATDGTRLLVRAVDLGASPAPQVGAVDVLVFPEFAEDAAPALTTITPADAFCRLATSLLRACSEAELEELAFLTAQRPAVGISFADPHTALALLDEGLTGATEDRPHDVAWIETTQLQAAGLRSDVRGIRFDGDSALWSRSLARIAHVQGWAAETPCDGTLATQLRSLGLLKPREAITDVEHDHA